MNANMLTTTTCLNNEYIYKNHVMYKMFSTILGSSSSVQRPLFFSLWFHEALANEIYSCLTSSSRSLFLFLPPSSSIEAQSPSSCSDITPLSTPPPVIWTPFSPVTSLPLWHCRGVLEQGTESPTAPRVLLRAPTHHFTFACLQAFLVYVVVFCVHIGKRIYLCLMVVIVKIFYSVMSVMTWKKMLHLWIFSAGC